MISGRRTGAVAALSGLLIALYVTACSPSATPPPSAVALPPTAAPSSPEASTSTDLQPAGDQCRIDDLSAKQGDDGYIRNENQFRVVWTNRSGRMCTMTGFGGVDLVNAQGQHYSAVRTTQSATTVSLPPGGYAHSTIRYVAAGGTRTFSPTTLLATPPNETHSARLPWGTAGVPYFDSPSAYEFSIDPVQPNYS